MNKTFNINIESIDLPIAICNKRLEFLSANREFYTLFSLEFENISLPNIFGNAYVSVKQLIENGIKPDDVFCFEISEDVICKLSSANNNSQDECFILTFIKEACSSTYNQCIETFIKYTPYPVMLFDKDFNFTRWSSRAEEVFGWKEEEVVGKRPVDFDFIFKDDLHIMESVQKKAGETDTFTMQNRNYRKDGKVLDCLWTNNVLRDSKRAIIGFLTFATDTSELEETKANLKDNELFLETIVDWIPYPIFYQNVKNEILNYNDSFKDYFLEEFESIRNLKLNDVKSFSKQESIKNIQEYDIKLVNSDENVILFEASLVCKDMVKRDFLVSKTKFINSKGDFQGIISMFIDITKIKAISEELFESKKLYEHLFQSSIDGIFFIDNAGKIVKANNAFKSLIGISDKELSNINITEIFKFEVKNDEFASEYEINSSDGKKKYIAPRIWEKRDAGGSLLGFWGIVRDVTHSKELENTLIENQLRYDLAIKGSSDGIWDWDIKNKKMWVSPRVMELFEVNSNKYDDSEQANRQRIHPEDYDRVFAHVDEHFTKNTPYSIEYRIRTDTGKYKWYLSRGIVTLNNEGEPYRMAGTLQCIDERKEMEEKEKKYTEELQRSNQELQQFAYIASHDLQEPLRMISSFLQLLSKKYYDKLDLDAKEYIDFAVDGSIRMQQMISDLLAYSRLQSSKKSFNHYDINKTLDKAIETLKESIKAKSANIYFDQMPHRMLCDEIQIFQVFMNLIGNSIKFSKPDEKPNIYISHSETDEFHYFKVKDNGIGIESKYYDRIFNIFQRLHTREEYPGTGIGLSICQKIIARHNGSINVNSEPSKGAEFIFSISKKLQGR